MSQLIDRTADTSPTAIQDVGVNHSGTDVFVSKQFLHGANIVAIFQQMSRKGMVKNSDIQANKAGWPVRL